MGGWVSYDVPDGFFGGSVDGSFSLGLGDHAVALVLEALDGLDEGGWERGGGEGGGREGREHAGGVLVAFEGEEGGGASNAGLGVGGVEAQGLGRVCFGVAGLPQLEVGLGTVAQEEGGGGGGGGGSGGEGQGSRPGTNGFGVET